MVDTFYHSLLLLRLNNLRSFGLRYWCYDDEKITLQIIAATVRLRKNRDPLILGSYNK